MNHSALKSHTVPQSRPPAGIQGNYWVSYNSCSELNYDSSPCQQCWISTINIEIITVLHYCLTYALHRYYPPIYFSFMFVDCSFLKFHFTDAYMVGGLWYPDYNFSLCHCEVNLSWFHHSTMFQLFFLFLHLSCFLYPQSASSQFVATLPISLMQCSTIANVRCGGSQGCCSAASDICDCATLH